MTTPAPWRCPDCRAWIAPHVTEHRCDPPEGGVKVTSIDPPGLPGVPMNTSTATLPGTITYNVSGSVVTGRELTDAVIRRMQKLAMMNPGRAA